MITINKPKFDKRDFYGGMLNNGIKYALINDNTLDRSYVSVTVNVGSFSNPKDYNGLAHFLEHMLFMGSKKYPNEDHYMKKLNELGGSSNAYTDKLNTVYYFNVRDEGLMEIIDIFSRFFIDPLFNNDSIQREINAVDNEHHKNIHNDSWRKLQFMLDIANEKSNVNTFITGSHNTLNKKDIRDKVILFYNKYYVSSNISIAIASSKEIKDTYNIINSTFGNIVNKIYIKNNEIIKPFYSNNKLKTYHLKTLSDTYSVTYIWEIPIQDSNYTKVKYFNILEMMLNNLSENSLSFHLKDMGYINYINIETLYEGIFNITFKLTALGFDNLNYIENILFNTLDNINKSDIKNNAIYYQKIAKINFDCMNKFSIEDLCNLLSVNHNYYDTANIFSGEFIIDEIKQTNEYKNLFSNYINKNNYIKILQSQNNYNNMIDKDYMETREYGTKYIELNLKVPSMQVSNQIFNIDIINDYTDTNPIPIVSDLETSDIPRLIGDRQWYGFSGEFNEPLIYCNLQINSNTYFNTSTNYILSEISCSILNFLVSTILYKPLEVCYNISFSCKQSTSSIVININGFNDTNKLKLLVNEFSSFLFNIKDNINIISDTYINNLIITFEQMYKNINFMNPAEYSSYIVSSSTITTEYTIDQILESLKKLSHDNIKKYIINLFNIDKSALTSFIYGNINVDDAINIFSQFNKLYFNCNNILPTIKPLTSITINHPNNSEKQNCISYYYPIGTFNPINYILLSLSVYILNQPFFNDLRTKNQLGYLVSMNIYSIRDYYYIVQKIQSGKEILFVQNKINDFNKNILSIVKKCNFDTFKDTIKHELEERDICISDKFYKFLPEISFRKYLFNRNKILLDKLKTITKKDLIHFIKNYIINANKSICIIKGN